MTGTAYGVRLEGDIVFDDLPHALEETTVFRVELSRSPVLPRSTGTLLNTYRAQDRLARLYDHTTYLSIRIDDLLAFELHTSDGKISCYCLQEVTNRQLRYWILQQMMPIMLILCGSHIFLHGTSVASESTSLSLVHPRVGCIGFLGQSHAGKSTLLNYFLSKGHSLVTDDHLAICGREYRNVQPTIPYYRPYRAVEDLGIHTDNFMQGLTPLDRLYVLWPVHPTAPVKLERLDGIMAISALLADNHYTFHDERLPRLLPLVRKRFYGCAQLSRQVPVIRLQVPRSMERLSEVYSAIQSDLAS